MIKSFTTFFYNKIVITLKIESKINENKDIKSAISKSK